MNTFATNISALLDSAVSMRVERDGLSMGRPQVSGALTVVPLLGADRAGYASPLVGAALAQVRTYGDVTLRNGSDKIGIVPLHLGYIQHGAQNHALCTSALLAPGSTRRFEDAACVQAAQGGYLAGQAQWFFLLPLELRPAALRLRGEKGYSKLWADIARLNAAYGLPARGHLEQILTKHRETLNRFLNRFERLENQIGALFLLGDTLVGIELAPDAAYFADVWMPLVCFVYGPAAWQAERSGKAFDPAIDPQGFAADSLESLRAALLADRDKSDAAVAAAIASAIDDQPAPKRESIERYRSATLSTIWGARFAGQAVADTDGVVYASLFATELWTKQSG